jgi:hypothetical protein
MKSIIVRNVDPALDAALRKCASKDATSINRVVLRLLRGSLGLRDSKREVRHSDLDALAGTWTTRQHSAFREATSSFEKVDAELWD